MSFPLCLLFLNIDKVFACCKICPSIFSWCNISFFLSFCLLFSLVPTCSRLKIPNHQPSQQGLSSRASHSGALYSRSVSDMVLQAFGFHPLGRAHVSSHWVLCTGKLLDLGTLIRSLMFLVWDCLSLDADAVA